MTKDLDGKTTREKLEKLPDVELILADMSVYKYKGKIEIASGIVDQQTGAVNIRASFPNPEGDLRSGGSGRVRLPENHNRCIACSAKSQLRNSGKTFCLCGE